MNEDFKKYMNYYINNMYYITDEYMFEVYSKHGMLPIARKPEDLPTYEQWKKITFNTN
jgi:hypothetical protein